MASRGAESHGMNTAINKTPKDPRPFYLSRNFIEISMSGTEWHDLTWGDLWVILVGLADYMVRDRHSYQATFQAISEISPLLAKGYIREVRGANRVAQS
ncbi:hypothetical protein ACLMJK_003715 [Lecanora helva]